MYLCVYAAGISITYNIIRSIYCGIVSYADVQHELPRRPLMYTSAYKHCWNFTPQKQEEENHRGKQLYKFPVVVQVDLVASLVFLRSISHDVCAFGELYDLIVYSYIYTKYLFYLFSHSYLVGEIGATTAAVQILWIYEFYMNVHTGGPVVQMAPNLRYVSQKYYTGEPFCPRASSNGWPLHCCCCRYILRSILIASAIWHAVSKTPFGFGTSIQQFSMSITAARHVIPLWIEWLWYRREYAYVFCCFIFLSIIYNPYIRYEYQVRVSWRILLLLLVQIESNLQKVEPTKP